MDTTTVAAIPTESAVVLKNRIHPEPLKSSARGDCWSEEISPDDAPAGCGDVRVDSALPDVGLGVADLLSLRPIHITAGIQSPMHKNVPKLLVLWKVLFATFDIPQHVPVEQTAPGK